MVIEIDINHRTVELNILLSLGENTPKDSYYCYPRFAGSFATTLPASFAPFCHEHHKTVTIEFSRVSIQI